eukprot:CAMPEP_0202482672 /NCGR_PEP_ID=MMETSP1361-20130828/2046_1 /ASSEMBLY_ACC=CAM_ASM_000849 /TAXON_ID=210615 /ORGANISM="Staurosira complex sp., Strain CCMP2646" /LENGTH=106 /DNA_ID=CAMNT_0049110637 /DNA_START=72 /DNA_END=392 /DNA_ORIENTATION=+
MISTHKAESPILKQERAELRSMARKMRMVKRRMFLKAVESSEQPPSPVDEFRSMIMDLAVQQEVREAVRSRSNSVASDEEEDAGNIHSYRSGSNTSSLRSLGSIQE